MPALPPEASYLLQLLAAVLHAVQPSDPPPDLDWEKLYALAVRHSVANMVGYGVEILSDRHRLPEEVLRKLRGECQKAVAKEAVQHFAVEEILNGFETRGIACMPLKGCLLKELYPRPHMRLMADIDILMRDEDSGRVQETLLALAYTAEHAGGNHDVYYRRPFMNIEMHRRLVSKNSPFSAYLSRTWERAFLKPGCAYTYELTKEDFYIYLLIHLAKHYTGGGTGIRSFMDIWVYHRRWGEEMDWTYIEAELLQIGLRTFEKEVRGVGEVWFGNRPINELYAEMTAYILSSGTYGTWKHSVLAAMGRQEKKLLSAQLVYLLKLFFPPLETMQILYPFLHRLPFLLPICWGLRGADRLLFKRRRTLRMIGAVGAMSGRDIDGIARLHEKAGL